MREREQVQKVYAKQSYREILCRPYPYSLLSIPMAEQNVFIALQIANKVHRSCQELSSHAWEEAYDWIRIEGGPWYEALLSDDHGKATDIHVNIRVVWLGLKHMSPERQICFTVQ